MTVFYVTVTVVVMFLLSIFRKILQWRELPPGPWGLPILGYLPWIDPHQPHETLTTLARKYGPIYGLTMGSMYTVVLSDPRLMRQAFSKDSFSGRAPLFLTHGIMNGYGIICAEGELWKEQRKFIGNCLRNFGMIKMGPRRDKMEERIVRAVDECVKKLGERSTAKGIDPLSTLHHCLGNLVNSLVFGRTYEEDDKTWEWLRHLQEEGVKHIGVAGPLNFLPFLRHLPRYGKVMELLLDGQRKTHDHYRKILEDQRDKGCQVDNFLKSFDEEMRARNETGDLGSFTESQCYYLLADLYGAGTDTALTSLRWFLLYIAAHSAEQEKIQAEMTHVLGDREPTLQDRILLPRLEAAISEIQRIRSVVPVGIPHGTIKDDQIGGYKVPKGSMIISLLWAVHTDPAHWSDPLDFKPDRFIGEDDSLLKPEAFIPFQAGKRMCIGDELARMVLFLFTSRILNSFTISIPLNEPVDLIGECGITLVPKPHRLVFTPRKSGNRHSFPSK